MTETESRQTADYVELSASIVTAYVANNSIPANELGGMLTSIHTALKQLSEREADASSKDEVVKLTPAQIKKSITPDAIISFEDGRSYKALRRHLTTRGLTPEEYRAKWGLPSDYPMTAASYSATRSELARSLGLGQMRKRSGKSEEASQPEETVPEPQVEAKPKRRGRPRKAAE